MNRPSQKIQNVLLTLGVGTIFLSLLGGMALWLRHKYFEASDFRQRVTPGKSEPELLTSEGKPAWRFGPGEESKLTERLKNSGCQPLPNLSIEGNALLYIRSFATYLVVYLDRDGRVTCVFTSQT